MTGWRELQKAALWALLCAPAVSMAATAPGFSCDKANSAVEKAICADPSLSAADAEMSKLYDLAKTSASGHGPSNVVASQRKALAERQRCADASKSGPIASCLQGFYATRNKALATSVLMQAPELALPVIRRADRPFAPVAEAIQLWASEPEHADWSSPARAAKRARIVALLTPYMHYVMTADDASFGRDILTSADNKDWAAVKSVDDIFRSEQQFAEFLVILGPYLDNVGSQTAASDASRDSGPRNVPCAAIVRHPALLRATESAFGSSMDNMIFGNDCRDTLPPVPALETLEHKLDQGWPQCEGTIRFALYRDNATDIDRALLGLPVKKPKPAPRRKGVTSADIDAARTALAGYYQTYFDKPADVAGKMAADALGDILSSAQECD